MIELAGVIAFYLSEYGFTTAATVVVALAVYIRMKMGR